MSYFVYRPKSSTGARELADALGGRRLRKFEGGRFFCGRLSNSPIRVRAGDTIVCWGKDLAAPAGISVLNGTPIRDKFTDAQTLQRAGVPTIEVSLRRPEDLQEAAAADPAVALHLDLTEQLEDFLEAPVARNDVYRRGLDDINTRLQRLSAALALAAPVGRRVPAGDWVGRVNNHTGGTDLLTPPPAPDYFVKKIQLVKEFRIHSFAGLSIRAGVKIPREGYHLAGAPIPPGPSRQAHAWVRSYDGGWKIDYNGFKSKERMRTLASQAVAALGLEFGAVDIGQKADKSLVVLEVNRAPGLSDGSVQAYVGAIERLTARAV